MLSYGLSWHLVWANSDRLYMGVLLSLYLALVSILLGMVIGLLGALVYTDGPPWARRAIAAYVEFIRNVPLLLLTYLVFYGLPSLGGWRVAPIPAFVATLAIYSGAYLVEVFRSGLDAVPNGLIDAGKAIGLSPWQRLFWVRIPTMFRIVLPSLSNTYISLFKDTSIASVIAVPELTHAANFITATTYRIVETYTVVAPMYLVTGWIISLILQRFERRFVIAR